MVPDYHYQPMEEVMVTGFRALDMILMFPFLLLIRSDIGDFAIN
jgi:hypothetical protein